MESNIVIFGREIPLYGLMFYLGIALAAGVAFLLCKRRRIEYFDLAGSAVYTMIGAVIGAKLLFIVVSWEQIVAYDLSLVAVIKGGFVFYGGMLGGLAGLIIYCLQFKMHFWDFADLYVSVLPLGHALGRVGCYFAGCCYGRPYDGPFAVVYENVVGLTPVGVPLFPIQLAEAFGLLLLFGIFITLFLKFKRSNGHIACMYLMAYAVLRFIIEMFRGDGERGAFLGVSTSQWVSIALFVSGAAFLALICRKAKINAGKTEN